MKRKLHHQAALLTGVILIVLCAGPASRGGTFVVSDSLAVEDAALLDREFGGWNFGSGLLLEAGYMPGLYELHHAASLIRFDLSGVECGQAQSAKLRLYKPKCFTQIRPIRVSVHEVSAPNAGWAGGSAECAAQANACSWNELKSGKAWAGAAGCSKEGTDYLAAPLDAQVAPADRGSWMEFPIPAALIQRWLDHPESNAGLYLRADKPATGEEQLGDHAYFYSSEHYLGKGPQLVIEGSPAKARTQPRKAGNPKALFPEADATFEKWTKDNNRYVKWTRICKLDRPQSLLMYWFDVAVRGSILMPRCRIPLSKNMDELKDLVAHGDEEGARKRLKEMREMLLVWEYIRETRWYDSGPTADVLSPLQLGKLWGQCVFGKMEQSAGDNSWKVMTPEELERHIQSKVAKTAKELELTAQQTAGLRPVIAECETREHAQLNQFRLDLAKVQELAGQGVDNAELFELVKNLHMSHELFLYYQSTFDTPRWTAFMNVARAIPLARVYIKLRQSQYDTERTEEQMKHSEKFGQ